MAIDISASHSTPLTAPELSLLHAWWRAANYLSVGQIYLLDNPLLRQPLELAHIKPRLLGHWGTTPGLNFIYVHLNRIIKARDLDMIYIAGPGHGGPGMVANTWLEGTYSEIYPTHYRRTPRACSSCSGSSPFPGGIPSHVAPETPGSIHEGGELDIRCRMPTVRPSTIRTWSLPAWSATARPKPGRWRRVALEQVSQSGRARCGAADPAPERIQDRQSHGAGAHRRTTS